MHRECNAKRGLVKMGKGVELHYNTFQTVFYHTI